MYWGFVIYLSVILSLVFLIHSQNFRRFVCGILCVAILFYGCSMLYGVANTKAEEVRTAHLIGFDLSNSVFVLQDEDGYFWNFKLEEDDYVVGDEYTIHLPNNDVPWYE